MAFGARRKSFLRTAIFALGEVILVAPAALMIRKSKWIEIHSPDEAAAEVAARSLDGRLRLVAHYLPLAAAAADDDDEHVHQTRVATRRAMTTLSIFEGLLPRKQTRWFRKQLKRVRKAANDARDYDVLADRLNERLEAGGGAACEKLLDWVYEQRREAQKPICKSAARLEKKRYKRRAKRLVRRVARSAGKDSGTETFGQLAQTWMRRQVLEFFAFDQAQLRDLEALHRFRVCGKHLRYAMEVFAGAFPRAFRDELYPQVESLQDQLGKINDHAVARCHYEKWLAATDDDSRRALLGELIEEEEAAVARMQRQFLDEWTVERASHLRQRFWEQLGSQSQPLAVNVG